MKKAIKALFVVLFLILMVSDALAAGEKNKSEIKTVDNYIAVFDFEVTTGDKGISRPLADKVIHVFSESNKYEVIDRGNMNKILGEQKFQMSGCVAQECKVEAGQILGVGKIVNGSVGLVGKTYYLTLQLIDVKTGKVELSAEDTCKCEVDDLLDSTKRLAKKLLGEKVEQHVATPATVNNPNLAVPEPKTTNSVGITFIYIKPGTFMMGSPPGEPGRDNDETQHQVTLTRGYYMGETEVTVGQWRAFARDSGYRTEAETGGGARVWTGKWEKKEGIYWDNPGFPQSDNHPVTCVSWNDVREFIKWLNRRDGNIYRLPSEAEWEYAARAGTTTVNYWGNNSDEACGYGNVGNRSNWLDWDAHKCDDGYAKTAPVKNYKPNNFGLYDMIGNVGEWCQDWYGTYPSSGVTDPDGPSQGEKRLARSCSWRNIAVQCRSAKRASVVLNFSSNTLGLRLARTP